MTPRSFANKIFYAVTKKFLNGGSDISNVKKKIVWLDTVRVFASFAIIIAHYLMDSGFDNYPFTRRICFDFASLGVFLFFAISGWLVVGSLNRSPSILDFYKRRIIRVVVPFTVSFIFLGSLFTLAGLFDRTIAERSPLYKATYEGNYFENLICALPIDMNLFVWFKIDFAPFVGEWFMAIIILMYLLAPFLKWCAERAPLITLAVSIAVSFVVFNATQELSQSGRLIYNWWLVLVRIPEFLFGMILAIKRDFLLKYRRQIELVAGIIFVAYTIHFLINKAHTTFLFFDCEPKVFLISFTTIILFFSAVERLNRVPSELMQRFNDFADISYPIMLIQHPMIFLFEGKFEFEKFHSFGIVFILLLLTWLIVFLSGFVKRFSEPVEKFFLRRV